MTGPQAGGEDYIIVLATYWPQQVANKTIVPDGAGGLAVNDTWKRITWWSGEEYAVDSFDSLVELLERISIDPRNIVTRGRIAEGVDRARMRRRKTTRADGTGTIDHAAHFWLMLDIEKLAADDFDPLADPEKTVRYVLERLPPAFRNASVWYQFTSGA